MAAATGTVVISQGGANFDSATFPRFVLGDGTNSLTFVIDNDARGLKLTGGADAENYSGASDLPFEDSQKTRLVVPTFDEADGAKKALLSFWITDEANFDDAFSDVSAINSGNITAITSRPHFCIRDAAGNEIKIGGGGKAGGTHTKADYESALSSSSYTLLGKYSSSGSPQFWLYKKDSAAEYFIYVNNEGTSGFRAHTVFGAALKHAKDNSLIDITTRGVLANGTLQALANVGNNSYTGSEIHGLVLEYDTAGFAGNACYMEFKDPNTHFDTAAKRLCMSWGYSEYVVGSNITSLGRHAFTGATNDQFWGNNLNSKIWFRQGTIAGSGSDASLSTENIAEAIKEMINGSYLGITATRSGSTVNLTNDTSGDSGNVTITTTNEGSLFSVSGMSNAGGGGGGGGGSEVARRSTISADQLALSASGGLASSSDNKSAIKLDLKDSLAALGASPDSTDLLAVADATSGTVTKITVAELVGSVAAGSDTQVQFNDGGSSLGGDSGLTYNKTTDTLSVGNDLKLTSDSAILSLGAGDDATLTHDGTTGLTIAATPISIDSTGELHLNSTTGDIKFQDGGTDQLALDMDGTAGEIIMQLKVDSDDFVFKQFDGTEVFRVEDDGSFDIAGGAGSSGVTVSSAGAMTVDGISTLGATTGVTVSAAGLVNVNNATDATSTTDGSLQTDGGLSVVKDIVAGNDVKLLSDSAVLSLGAGSDATLTHDGTTGVTLAANPITLDSAGDITLDADDADIIFKDGGTEVGSVNMASSNLTIKSAVSDKDIIFMGNDGGSPITALTLDMSNAGRATFNENVVVSGDLTVQGTTTTVDSTTINISQSFTFEGPADDHETTLHAGTPAADSTVFLPALSAGSYHLPALADAATDASAAVTAAEFALLDGGSSVGTTALASGDGFMHNDGGTMKHTQIDKIADLFAGSGLSASSAVLSVDLAQVSAADVDVANDSILIIDANDSNATKKESVADLATGMAGAGIGVSSGVLSLDIDELSALGGTGVAQGDHFVFSDDGTEKKITFSNLEDAIFGNISGQAAIAAGGAISLDVSAITAQTEMTGDVADADEFMISDGGVLKRADFSVIRDAVYNDVSGDAAIADGGALTIQANAVESGMLNDNVISGQTELASDGLAAADEMMISDAGTLKKIGVDNLFKDGPGLLSAADISVSADHIMFLDGGATGDAKIESVADVVAGVASAGLQASAGQLSIASVEDHFMSSSAANGDKVFTLSQTPASNASVSVYINGIFQVQSGSHATIAGGDYSISGTTVTLVNANAIDASDEVVVKYIKQ